MSGEMSEIDVACGDETRDVADKQIPDTNRVPEDQLGSLLWGREWDWYTTSSCEDKVGDAGPRDTDSRKNGQHFISFFSATAFYLNTINQ